MSVFDRIFNKPKAAKRVYVSFNRHMTDLDVNNDRAFKSIIFEHIYHDGGVPVGEELNDSVHLENIVKTCDEVWICLRAWKNDSGESKHELPGALMCMEKRMAETLKIPVIVKHFVFNF